MDERVAGPIAGRVRPAEKDAAEASAPPPPYSDAAREENQRRITDLIPQRLIALVMVATAGIVTGALVVVGHVYLDRWRGDIPREQLAAFDLAAPQSLAVWYSTILLATAAVASILIYTIRQHRTDDYRGRYRVWLWAAAVWMLGSVSAAVPLDRAVAAVMQQLTGAALGDDGVTWGGLATALLLLPLGAALVFELRVSSIALSLLLLAGFANATSAAVSWGWIVGPDAAAFGRGAALFSHVLLATALVAFARHVFLEAQGRIPAARRKRTSRKRAEAAAGASAIGTEALPTVSSASAADGAGAPASRRRFWLFGRKTAAETPASPPRNRRRERAESSRQAKRTAPASTATPRRSDLEPPTGVSPDDAPRRVAVRPSRPTSAAAADADAENDAELKSLLNMEEHLLTKTQRRRIKKLQRRTLRQAG